MTDDTITLPNGKTITFIEYETGKPITVTVDYRKMWQDMLASPAGETLITNVAAYAAANPVPFTRAEIEGMAPDNSDPNWYKRRFPRGAGVDHSKPEAE